MSKSITVDQLRQALESCNGNMAAAARLLNVPRSNIWYLKKRYGLCSSSPKPEQPLERCDWTESDTSASLRIVTRKRIRTLQEALEYAEADLDEWEAVKFTITSHEQAQKDDQKNPRVVSLWNVKAELRRRKDQDPQRVKSDVIELCKGYSPKIRPPSRKRTRSKKQYMLEISCPDIHIGKLCDKNETGEEYSIDIAKKLYLDAHEHLLSVASSQYNIGHIINIPSNDILHFAGPTYATTKGTKQDTAGTWQQAYKEARKVAVDGVLMCREVAPTKIITHGDNHANAESFYIGDALECYFHHDKHVEIDNGPAPYKYHRYGDVFLMFGHCHNIRYEDLQATMAHDDPKSFSECSVKEVHAGHLHKQQLIDGYGDLVLRRLPSLSATDSWHASKGYRSKKCAQAFVWSEKGLESVIYYSPSPDEYR